MVSETGSARQPLVKCLDLQLSENSLRPHKTYTNTFCSNAPPNTANLLYTVIKNFKHNVFIFVYNMSIFVLFVCVKCCFGFFYISQKGH